MIKAEGVAIITFRVNSTGGNGTGCFEVKIRANTTKLTNVRMTRFGQCRDLVRKSEMFINDEAKIISRVGCST